MSNQWQKEVNSRQSDQQEELLDLSEDKKIRTVADLEKDAESARKEKILAEQKKAAEKEDDEDYIPPLAQSQEPKTSAKPEELKEYSEMVAQQLQIGTDSTTVQLIATKDQPTSSGSPSFLDLPEELIKKSLEGLHPQELAKLGLVSKDAERISADPELWRSSFLRKDTKSKNPKSDYGDEKKFFERDYKYWPTTSYHSDKAKKIGLLINGNFDLYKKELPQRVEDFMKAGTVPKLQELLGRGGESYKKDFMKTIDAVTLDTLWFVLPIQTYPRLHQAFLDIERTKTGSALYHELFLNYEDYRTELFSLLGEFLHENLLRFNLDNPEYDYLAEMSKFFANIIINYPEDWQALLSLAKHIIISPQQYNTVRHSIGGTHDNATDFVNELFSRLLKTQRDNLTLSEIYFKIGLFLIQNPQIPIAFFERAPELWALLQKRQAKANLPDEPQEQKLDYSSISTLDLAKAALSEAAELDNHQAKIIVASINDLASENYDEDDEVANESATTMLDETQKTWLALDSQKYLINASKHEQDYAFFNYCYEFINPLSFDMEGISSDNIEEHFSGKIRETQSNAIESTKETPMPKWLYIILRSTNEKGKFEPKYVIDGLAKKLGIGPPNYYNKETVSLFYTLLANNLLAAHDRIKSKITSEKEQEAVPLSEEEEKLFLGAIPCIDLLLKESGKLGSDHAKSLHTSFLKRYEFKKLQILEKGNLEEALFKAVLENNEEVVKIILEEKPKLNLRKSDICTSRELQTVELSASDHDKTLLSLSIKYASPEITRLLLAAGADANIPDNQSRLAIHHALYLGAWEQANMLLNVTNPDQYKLGLNKDYTGLNIAVKGALHRKGNQQPTNLPIPSELIDSLIAIFRENPNSPLAIAPKDHQGEEIDPLCLSTLGAVIKLGNTETIRNLLQNIPTISHNDYTRITTQEDTHLPPWLVETLSKKLGTTNEQALISLLDGLHNRLGENSDLYKVFRNTDPEHNIAEKKLLKVVTDFFDTAPTDKKQASSATTTPSETPHTPQPG